MSDGARQARGVVTVRVPDGRPGETRALFVARSGVVTREDSATVTEADVAAVIRVLARSDRHELAGRVQGWWWTSGVA